MARMTINSLAVSTGKGLWPPEFMTLFLFMFEWSHKSHFSILFFKFLKNGNFHFWQFWHQRVLPLEKNWKILKTIFFSKNYTFSFWICIVHILSVLLRYITLMYLKILNFYLFLHTKFQFFFTVFQRPAWPKLQFIKCCFWCLWTAKDQKNWMEVNFGL